MVVLRSASTGHHRVAMQHAPRESAAAGTAQRNHEYPSMLPLWCSRPISPVHVIFPCRVPRAVGLILTTSWQAGVLWFAVSVLLSPFPSYSLSPIPRDATINESPKDLYDTCRVASSIHETEDATACWLRADTQWHSSFHGFGSGCWRIVRYPLVSQQKLQRGTWIAVIERSVYLVTPHMATYSPVFPGLPNTWFLLGFCCKIPVEPSFTKSTCECRRMASSYVTLSWLSRAYWRINTLNIPLLLAFKNWHHCSPKQILHDFNSRTSK
jgi:hypothetical protein